MSFKLRHPERCGISTVRPKGPEGQATGGAEQHAINNSGIHAEILFLDTGSDVHGLVLSGKASGLDPTQTYFSLLYDRRSLPGGPRACVPSPQNDITFPQMFTAVWTVAPDGTGTLFSQKTGGAYVPLGDVQRSRFGRLHLE
jgi:hypothetical protein